MNNKRLSRTTTKPPRLPKNKQPDSISGISITQQTTQLYQGPIPSPEILEGFERLVPGTAEKLISLVVQESEHRRDLELKTLNANIEAQRKQQEIAAFQAREEIRLDRIGQRSSILIVIGCIAGAIYLAPTSPMVAGALVSMPIASILKAFWKK